MLLHEEKRETFYLHSAVNDTDNRVAANVAGKAAIFVCIKRGARKD